MSYAWTHSWCRSPARDEAVRASEDGRSGPLPTLEEAIAAASPLPGRVEGTHWADWERLRDQRDAAIRERDELRVSYRHCRAANTLVCDERDTLKASVAELESQLESVADRAAAAENRVVELEANANTATLRAQMRDAEWSMASELAAAANAELSAAPAASGAAGTNWLTAEEREAVTLAAQQAPECDFVTTVEGKWINKTLTDLLARSSPPEVVLPVCEFTRLSTHMMGFLEAIGRVKKALAAAGVTCKEVGRE